MVQTLMVGTRKSRLPAALKVLVEDYGGISSCRSGATALMCLWVSSRNLQPIC